MKMIRKEWDAVLMGSNVRTRLEELQVAGVIRDTFPEVQAMVGFGGGDSGHKDLWGHTKQVVSQTVRRLPLLRWAALFHDVGKVKCFRHTNGVVSFHNHEAMSARMFDKAAKRTGLFSDREALDIRTYIYDLGYIEGYLSEWSDSAVRRVYRQTGTFFEGLIHLSRADITTKYTGKRQTHYLRIKELRTRALRLAEADALLPPLPTGLGDVLLSTFKLHPAKELGPLMKKLKKDVELGLLERSASVETILAYIEKEKLL